MNKIIENQMDEFCKEFHVSTKDVSERFEHFANYCTFLNVCPTAFSVVRDAHLKVRTGQGGDCGIDGVLILINDTPVFSCEEAKSIMEGSKNRPIDVEFIFVQAKTSSTFDSGEMLKTREGVLKFFSSTPMGNGILNIAWQIQNLIYQNSIRFRENPKCRIYYVTTGKWVDDPNLVEVVTHAENAINDTNLFSDVDYIAVDAVYLQKLYKNLSTSITKQIKFEKKQSFPQIEGTSQSFIGLIEGNEFIELITLEGNLNKTIFYENVRAFLGENSVNIEIAETLENEETKKRFPILNNGVTIVARELNLVGDMLTLRDFQIVNGCQTSYVLYAHKNELAGVMVPVKIIASEDQDVINMIIRSTNRQTQVTSEAFESIKEIQKQIQDYYNTYSFVDRLYYERRNREYDRINAGRIPRAQVFTIPMQVMTHSAMFLDKPHIAEKQYYGKLLRDNSSVLFQKDDLPIVYYTSARTLFKVESWLYNLNDKKLYSKIKGFRFQIILIIRLMFQDKNESLPPMNSHKMEKLCNKILTAIEDCNSFESVIKKAVGKLFDCATVVADKNGNVDQEKLTKEILKGI